MALKLGELLVKKGMVTENQLNEALRAQQLFGGRLGTNLVELGYLTEHALAQFLSAQMGLPAIGAADIENVPRTAIQALPRELAAKHKVMPLSIQQRRMRLGMADPTDLKAIDEVSFSTGFQVIPVVTPELLINYALEKYYGISRSVRYVKLTGTSEAEFQIVQTSDQAAQDAVDRAEGPLKVEARSTFLQGERTEFAQTPYTVIEAYRDLASAGEQRDVFDVLRKLLLQSFERVAIFVVRNGALSGWIHAGCDVANDEFTKSKLDPSGKELGVEGPLASGPTVTSLPSSPAGDWLGKCMGVRGKREVLLVPVSVNASLVSVVLASCQRSGEMRDSLELLTAIATKTSYALQAAYLRKRILEP